MSRGPKAWLAPEAQARLERVLDERLPAGRIAKRFRISDGYARKLARQRGVKLMSELEYEGAE